MITLPTAVIVLAAVCVFQLGALCLVQARVMRQRAERADLYHTRAIRAERMAEHFINLLRAHGLGAYVDTTERRGGRALDEHFDQVAAVIADPRRG